MRQIISTFHVRRLGFQSQLMSLNGSNFSTVGQHEFCLGTVGHLRVEFGGVYAG